jgi:hypothetical protein
MNWLTTLFKDVKGFFASPKAKAVEKEIAALLPVALTIVQDINAIAPNRTLTQINAVATKYALPAITTIAADPAATGNTLLNMATAILQKNHAPTASVSLLNTVVQLAVTAASVAA